MLSGEQKSVLLGNRSFYIPNSEQKIRQLLAYIISQANNKIILKFVLNNFQKKKLVYPFKSFLKKRPSEDIYIFLYSNFPDFLPPVRLNKASQFNLTTLQPIISQLYNFHHEVSLIIWLSFNSIIPIG